MLGESMSHGLQQSQRLSQQMVLSPQLQQSLALLQAPVMELKAMIEQELQQNPVLEESAVQENPDEGREDPSADGESNPADPTEPPADTQYDPATEKPTDEPVDRLDVEMQRLLQMDQEWRDHFSQSNTINRAGPEDEERRQHMFDSIVAGSSLQENLLEQLSLADLPPDHQSVGEMLVGNIDDRGYLQSGVAELSFSTGIAIELLETVLKAIQTLDPPGVGARDLRECLMLQLERAGRTESLEYRILSDHFEALGRRRFPDIARALGRPVDDIQTAAQHIAQLDPHPAGDFSPDNNQYVTAEVTVSRNGADWTVQTHNEFVPHLRISNHYKDLLAQSETSTEVREYIREKIRAGKFLIKSIHQRQDTIGRIAQEIVNRQREFLEKGPAHLKPLTMNQVAEVVGVHETTVSRAVSGKYIQTPRGLFEMKYFFTSGVRTTSGDSVSNTTVKTAIEVMFASEDKTAPLSDEVIVNALKAKGIVIARRTVAKYRAELGILPSHLRKAY